MFSYICIYIFQAKTKKKKLDYEFLTGQRRNGRLVYVRKYKCLYVKKKKLKSGIHYICYQTILAKNMKKNVKKTIPRCTSRVKIDNHGICTHLNIPHSVHDSHELLYKDMKSKNNFIDDVEAISKRLEDLSTQVSSQDLFTRELAKLV